MGAGYHGINGTGPETSNHLLQIYVTPRLIYGLEALCLSPPELCTLEEYYKNNFRQLQFLNPTTAKVAVYLLIGILPIEAQIHIKTLTFYANILRRQNSLEREVIERQLAMKRYDSHSWTVHMRKLL